MCYNRDIIHMIGVKQVLRYEEIIKEYLQANNVKLLGIEQDNRRILVDSYCIYIIDVLK